MTPADGKLFSRAFVLCWIANFAQAVGFSLFLHFPGLLKEMGTGESRIGVILSLAPFAAMVTGPFFGRLMDRRGRLVVIRGGTLLGLLTFAWYLSFDAMTPALYAARLFHGIAEGMLYGAFFTYAADRIPASRTAQGIALFGASTHLAISAGGLVGDFMIATGGYRALFLTSVAFGAVGFGLSLFLPESKPAPSSGDETPRHLFATILQRDLAPLWVSSWLYFFSMAGVFAFLKTYVMATGLGTLGAFFTIYTMTAIVQRLFLSWVPDRYGLKRVLGPALVIFSLGFVTLGTASTTWQFYAAAFLCGLGHGFSFPCFLGLVTRRARDAERGTAMTLFTTVDDAGVLASAPVLGFLIETTGYPTTFLFAAGLVLAAITVFYLWETALRSPASGESKRHEDSESQGEETKGEQPEL